MKQDPAFFEDCEPRLVYIAKRLDESLKLEGLLSEAGFDFGVEADRYRGGFIFQTERVGAFFYVRPEAEQTACDFLISKGYRPAPPDPALPESALE